MNPFSTVFLLGGGARKVSWLIAYIDHASTVEYNIIVALFLMGTNDVADADLSGLAGVCQ